MSLTAGTRLGPYEILAPLGAGGMGEVYRARDSRLDRTVAVKVLPEHLSTNEELRQRFEREARTVSSLNHPHICTLHDIGQQDGVDYLVLEYLEGESLAQRLDKGPLPVQELLRFGTQIADALDKAHRQGIVHRDLKPANVMLTKAGAKLLDFGLAKVFEAQPAARQSTMSILATEQRELTAAGMLLGTFQYMSPEQLEGAEADARSDLFALGAILYEMATGRKAFQGKSQASLIGAILHAEPAAVSSLQPMAPPALDQVIRTCLAKDPDQRWQTAHDVMLQLKWIADAGSQAGIPAPVIAKRKNRERLAWVSASALGLMLLGSLALNVAHIREPQAPAHVQRFVFAPPAEVSPSDYDTPMISPDGRHVVFAGATGSKRQLWLRALDTLESRPLPGTEGSYVPFWSPDSRQIAFCSQGKLMKVDLSGGPAQTLSEAGCGPGAWNRDGLILFIRDGQSGIVSVTQSGGALKPVTELDKERKDISHRMPFFLPDQRHFLFLARCADAGKNAIFVGSLDGGPARQLLPADSGALYASNGYLLYSQGTTAMAVPFDAQKQVVTGEPIPLVERVMRSQVFNGIPGFSISADGILAYRQGESNQGLQLVWFDRNGKSIGKVGDPGLFRQLILSPDERRVVVERRDPKDSSWDLWLVELSSSIFSRLTFSGASEQDPIWAPDSRSVVYTSVRGNAFSLNRKLIGGEGESVILDTPMDKVPEDWTPDGKMVLFQSRDGKIIYGLPLSGDRQPKVLLENPFRKDEPHLSPDGRWVAYASSESGSWEVYLAAFPAFTEKRQISNAGGGESRWRKDGRELFYRDLEGNIMAVDIRPGGPGGGVTAGIPRMLFRGFSGSPQQDYFAASGDGQRFLTWQSEHGDQSVFGLVLNWPALLPPKK